MAPTTNNTTSSSSIGLALAGKTASVDIPQPRDSVCPAAPPTASATLPTTLPSHHSRAHPPSNMLPTPPNSISPSLPPQGFKRQLFAASARPPALPPTIDSDIDLQDPEADSSLVHDPNDGADGVITPALLAKHHLPSILLNNGPLAIRHVMSYLTVQVPGFSGIPPAKARRLVVGALEGRRAIPDSVTGNPADEVIFEKVGWGRWDARIKGQPLRDAGARGLSPPASVPGSYEPSSGLRRPSWAATGDRDSVSAVFSHDEEAPYASVLEDEADKMSLDSSENNGVAGNGDSDDTDAEDWAAIGAAALRAASAAGAKGFRRGRKAYLAKPAPVVRGYSPYPTRATGRTSARDVSRTRGVGNVSNTAYRRLSEAEAGGAQEREAIEALVNLGRA